MLSQTESTLKNAVTPQFVVQERAVLYARISGDDRKYATSGLESQIEMGRNYAKEKGYNIVAELREDDRGASGAEINLPELNQARVFSDNYNYPSMTIRNAH